MEKYLRCVHSEHEKSLWCNEEGCWEAKGLSSRTIEKRMRGIKLTAAIGIWNHPMGSDDFGRCLEIIEAHPDWKGRFAEMKKEGYGWSNLVDNWDTLEQMYRQLSPVTDEKTKEKQSLEDFAFSESLNELYKDGGKLRTCRPDGCTEVGHVYVGSFVPQQRESPNDIEPCVVCDASVNGIVTIFTADGRKVGSKTIGFHSDDVTSSEMQALLNEMDAFVQSNAETFRCITFNQCPVYKLKNDTDDEDESQTKLYFAEIYSLDMCEILGKGLYMIPNSHVLLSGSRDGVIYQGANWTVSGSPISKNVFYDEGMLNA